MTSERACTRWPSCRRFCILACCHKRQVLEASQDMGISDRILGKKNVNGKPHIDAVRPSAALPGGEVRIVGSGLRPAELRRPRVQFGEVEGSVLISSDDFLVARVPEGAMSGPVVVATNGHI